MRITNSDTHSDYQNLQNTTSQSSSLSSKRPDWLGDVGLPCGFCCLKLWWKDTREYPSKEKPFNCPVTLPNQTEYFNLCIDYSKSTLFGINTLDYFFHIRNHRAFQLFRAGAVRLGKNAKYIPLQSLNPKDLPQSIIDRKLSGEQVCQQYHDFLKNISTNDPKNQGDNKIYDIDGYSWTENENQKFCTPDCDCKYPCVINPNISIGKQKIWDGSDCVCGDNTYEDQESELPPLAAPCLCGDEENSFFKPDTKTIVNIKSITPGLNSLYPIGKCDCKQKTEGNIPLQPWPTFLYLPSSDTNDCPDCECKQSIVMSNFNRYKTDSIWVPDTGLFKPGTCQCDDTKGLTYFYDLSNINDTQAHINSSDLLCKCIDRNKVWDPDLQQCVLTDKYIDWGRVEITQNFYDSISSSGVLGTETNCPTQFGAVKYTIKFIVDDLTNADGANCNINIIKSPNLSIKQWKISTLKDPQEIAINKEDLYKNPLPPKTSKTIAGNKFPKTFTIGKHYEENTFFVGGSYAHQYYNRADIGSDLKHFKSNNVEEIDEYTVVYTIVAQIDDFWDFDTNSTSARSFYILARFLDLKPYFLDPNKKARDLFNVGAGDDAVLRLDYNSENCTTTTVVPTTTTTVTPTTTTVTPTTTTVTPTTTTPAPDHCEDPYSCISVDFLEQGTSVSSCEPVIYGTQTVNVPEGMTLPVYVTLTGNADDLLIIDGQVVDAGQFVSYYYCSCETGCYVGAGNYSFTLNSSSFTIATGDTVGGNAVYSYTVCFYQVGGDCGSGTGLSSSPHQPYIFNIAKQQWEIKQ
jgi:hypothetical protein